MKALTFLMLCFLLKITVANSTNLTGTYRYNIYTYKNLWKSDEYTLFANANSLIWNVHVVVGNECVYSKIEKIIGATFNATTQICCPRSGMHARYQEEMEIGCCGGKYQIFFWTIPKFVYIRNTFHVSKSQFEKKRKDKIR